MDSPSTFLRSFPLPGFDPLTAFRELCPDGPGFLESLNPLSKTGRYTILPLRNRELYRLTDPSSLTRHDASGTVHLNGSPLAVLKRVLHERSCSATSGTPFPGGFFGYFGYPLAGWIEDLPARAQRDLPVPDLQLYWVDVTAVYDHQRRRLTLASLDPAVDLEELEICLKASQNRPWRHDTLRTISAPRPLIPRRRFLSMVAAARDYIAAGDIYQANLSCRFDSEFHGSSLELYSRLRSLNPAPFACLLNFPGLELISSSPERLVSLQQGLAESRPIAGTRPRGYTPPEDHHLGEELLGHPKERAEHIMLLDLVRNDLGKVCCAGTVRVDELMVLERYSHVTHIVSNVCGQLRDDCGPFDLLHATFPGGTITGVPKKRCMEIIDELEPISRGSYTGSAGYISACGNMDLNILIRGFQRLDSHLSYQTGAGIVADSVPAQEWRECLHKGDAMRTLLTGEIR